MNLKEAEKIYMQISIEDALTVIDYYDFKANLGNFNIPEGFIEMLWDFTVTIIENNFNLSEAYNFKTVSYALMAYLEENEMDDLIDNLFPTPEAKLFKSPNYNFVQQTVYEYNDLETTYEI